MNTSEFSYKPMMLDRLRALGLVGGVFWWFLSHWIVLLTAMVFLGMSPGSAVIIGLMPLAIWGLTVRKIMLATAPGPQVVFFDNDEYGVRAETSCYKAKWANIRRYKETRTHIILVGSDNVVVRADKQAIPDAVLRGIRESLSSIGIGKNATRPQQGSVTELPQADNTVIFPGSTDQRTFLKIWHRSLVHLRPLWFVMLVWTAIVWWEATVLSQSGHIPLWLCVGLAAWFMLMPYITLLVRSLMNYRRFWKNGVTVAAAVDNIRIIRELTEHKVAWSGVTQICQEGIRVVLVTKSSMRVMFFTDLLSQQELARLRTIIRDSGAAG